MTLSDEYMLHLEVNEFTNALDYLKMAEQALKDSGNPFRWKWAVIGISNCLYGLLIVEAAGTNWHRVVDNNSIPKEDREDFFSVSPLSEEQWKKWVQRRDERIEKKRKAGKSIQEGPMLISFNEVFCRLNSEKSMRPYEALKLSSKQQDDIKELRTIYRNTFEHFLPMTLYIYIGDIINPLIESLEAINQLSQLHYVNFHMYDHGEEFTQVFSSVKKSLEKNATRLKDLSDIK